MKRLLTIAAMSALIGGAAFGSAAQAAPQHHYDRGRHYDRHDRYDRYAHHHWNYDHGYRHTGWHTGGYVPRDYWSRGRRIDYRYYHLRPPPRGYEWRYVDGDYVLAGITTGLIASIVLGG